MKKISCKLLGGVALTIAALAAPSVQARPLADIYTDCGIGGVIFSETSWAAVSSNIIWDFGTTAAISDASSAENCKGGKAQTAAYVFHSYAQLEQDLARGQGEHLDTLMASAGCSAAAQPQVMGALRTGLAARVASPGYATASRDDNVRAMLNTLDTQVGACAL